MAAAWVSAETADLDWGDARLVRRAEIILDDLSQMAESPPDAAMSNADLKAVYRFMDNPAVSFEKLMESHNQASIRRAAQYERVVLAQDTTVIDLTRPNVQVEGAGPLESNDKFGFFVHPLYALTEDGIGLGIVYQEVWTRESLAAGIPKAQKDRLLKQKEFVEKESQRWLACFQQGEQIARANPGTEFTIVGDSESDIFEIYSEAGELAKNCHFVVRGCQDRALTKDEVCRSIDDALAVAPTRFIQEVEISERESKIVGETRARRQTRTARLAEISIRVVRVTIRGSARLGGKLPNVTLNVVEAVELDPPPGEQPIRWVLLTTLPVDTEEQIRRVISCYACRWNIELLFKTLKSGLKAESLGFETLPRYLNMFAMLLIVACHVELLKGAARHDGEASVEKYFPAGEWKPTYIVYTKGGPLPAKPPTITAFMHIIAELGGWQRKKSQGPPGSMTIWRGLRKMEAYNDAFLAYEQSRERCGV